MYFSDIRFLKNVSQSTKQQKRLKEWLVLLARLAAITALVIAFAKPFLPIESSSAIKENVILVVDNSSSNQIGIGDVSPFERNKQKALKLIEEFSSETRVALITAGSEHRLVNFKPVKNCKEDVLKLEPVDRSLDNSSTNLPEASVFIFSDFQKSDFPDINQLEDSSNWTFIPATTDGEYQIGNAAIDSFWTEAPFLIAGNPIEFKIKLKNYASQNEELNIEVLTNSLPEISFSTLIKANNDSTLSIMLTQLKSGFNTIQINILNDDVEFDNRFEFSFYLPKSNAVVELYEQYPSKLLKRLFKGDEFEFNSFSSTTVKNNVIKTADLIIINGVSEISSGLEATLLASSIQSNILFIPTESGAENYNSILQKLGAKVYGAIDTAKLNTQRINSEDPFFADVFVGSVKDAYWPTINNHYKFIGKSRKPSFSLMTMANGDDLYLRTSNGNTNIFQLAIPLSEKFSDIANHPVVVPVFIKALMKKDNLSYLTGIVGEPMRFDLRVKDESTDTPIRLIVGKNEIIPRQQQNGENIALEVGRDLDRAGSYKLIKNVQEIGQLSFVINKKESDLARYTESDLRAVIESNATENISMLSSNLEEFTASFKEWQLGKQFWKHFLIAALIFLLVEVILLRLLK